MPNELLSLYLGNTKESEHFRTYIRLYNNMFAFTSLEVKYDKVLAKKNHGIYTFKVQGQMYHFINDLIPSHECQEIYNYIFMMITQRYLIKWLYRVYLNKQLLKS